LNGWLNQSDKQLRLIQGRTKLVHRVRNKASGEPASTPRLVPSAGLGETKAKILDATFRRLALEGYAALNVRAIAKDAGVNHALINYHFRTKDQLVIAVLDEANRQLLARQQRMYGEPVGFAQKWAKAREFYEDDLASGFVRVQAELWAASFSDQALREKFLPRILAWKKVVLGGVQEALAALATTGGKLPKSLTAEVIATWISEFWLGMEFADLIGANEKQLQHRAALDAVQHLLEALDARVKKGRPRARRQGVAEEKKGRN
jgi:AcrR family transcriptional regulator